MEQQCWGANPQHKLGLMVTNKSPEVMRCKQKNTKTQTKLKNVPSTQGGRAAVGGGCSTALPREGGQGWSALTAVSLQLLEMLPRVAHVDQNGLAWNLKTWYRYIFTITNLFKVVSNLQTNCCFFASFK